MWFRSWDFRWLIAAAIMWLGHIQQYSVSVAQLALLQVKMGPFQSCSTWEPNTESAVRGFFMLQVSQGIRARCLCDFNETHFVTPTMLCEPSSPNSPTFRAGVIDVTSTNGAVVNSRDIVGHASSWVESNPSIMSGLASITVDSSCPISPTSFQESGCLDLSSCITVTALAGALIIEFIILCIIGFVTFAIFVTVFTSRRKIKRKLNNQKRYAVKSLHHQQQHLPAAAPYQNSSLPRPTQNIMIPATEVPTQPCPAYGSSFKSSS